MNKMIWSVVDLKNCFTLYWHTSNSKYNVNTNFALKLKIKIIYTKSDTFQCKQTGSDDIKAGTCILKQYCTNIPWK